jgi:hypothetical protein
MSKVEMILKSLEATGDPSMVDWIGPLLQFFSTHYLQSTIKSRPTTSIEHRWHSLINKMHHRREIMQLDKHDKHDKQQRLSLHQIPATKATKYRCTNHRNIRNHYTYITRQAEHCEEIVGG